MAYSTSLFFALPLIVLYVQTSNGGSRSWGLPTSIQTQAARLMACSPNAKLRVVPWHFSNPQNVRKLAVLHKNECTPSTPMCSVVELQLHELLCIP